jgi:hypothetical protein
MNTTTATTAQVLADNYRSLTRELEAARQAESDAGGHDETAYREQTALKSSICTVQLIAKQLGLVDEIVELLNK